MEKGNRRHNSYGFGNPHPYFSLPFFPPEIRKASGSIVRVFSARQLESLFVLSSVVFSLFFLLSSVPFSLGSFDQQRRSPAQWHGIFFVCLSVCVCENYSTVFFFPSFLCFPFISFFICLFVESWIGLGPQLVRPGSIPRRTLQLLPLPLKILMLMFLFFFFYWKPPSIKYVIER